MTSFQQWCAGQQRGLFELIRTIECLKSQHAKNPLIFYFYFFLILSSTILILIEPIENISKSEGGYQRDFWLNEGSRCNDAVSTCKRETNRQEICNISHFFFFFFFSFSDEQLLGMTLGYWQYFFGPKGLIIMGRRIWRRFHELYIDQWGLGA
jgi:hypothetical protein